MLPTPSWWVLPNASSQVPVANTSGRRAWMLRRITLPIISLIDETELVTQVGYSGVTKRKARQD